MTSALPEVLEKLVPREKVLPDLLLATYHESRGWNDCRQAMLALIREHGPALLRDAGDGARLDWLCSGDLKMVEESPARCFRVYRDIAPPDDEHARWQALTEAVFPTARAAIDAAMHAPGGD